MPRQNQRSFRIEHLESRQLMARDSGLDWGGSAGDDALIDPRAGLNGGEIFIRAPYHPQGRITPLPFLLEPTAIGNVSATLVDGNLFLSEAAGFEGGENGIRVIRLGDGIFRIEGISAAGGSASLINGAAFQDFVVTGSLNINFGAGKDRVEFDANNGLMNFQNVLIDVGANTAAGDADADFVSINRLQTTGSLTIRTGASNDAVQIHTLSGFAGDVDIRTYSSPDEAGDDVVNIDGLVRFERNLTIELGAGSDGVFLNNIDAPLESNVLVAIGGAFVVDAGAGNDKLFLAGMMAGGSNPGDGLSASMGAGEDTVKIDNSWFGGITITTFTSLAETDRDVVQMQRTGVSGDVLVDLGGGDDDFLVTDPNDATARQGISANSLYVTTGEGKDRVHVEGSNVGYEFLKGVVSVMTGAGADWVVVDFSDFQHLEYGSITPELHGILFIKTYDSADENDGDAVFIPTLQVVGAAYIDLGGGVDTFDVRRGNAHTLDIDAGAGSDYGYVICFVENQLRINMGAGDDYLTLQYVRALGSATFDGGDGFDNIRKLDGIVVDHIFENGWEGNAAPPRPWEDFNDPVEVFPFDP